LLKGAGIESAPLSFAGLLPFSQFPRFGVICWIDQPPLNRILFYSI
jgi:hypothetical protein